MDAISYSYADKQAKRIKKFINDPDSTSGVLTVPKVIASGESVTIPAGRVAILPDVQVDGTLNVLGDIFIPSGTANSKVVQKVASTDRAVAIFNGTTGDIQNSGVIIDGSNNVGIGVSSPSSKLHIHNEGGLSQIYLSGNAVNSTRYKLMQGTPGITNGGFTIWDESNNISRLNLDSAGNVGIGTVPSAWNTAIKSFQIGNGASLISPSSTETILGANYYRDTSDVNRYINTGFATKYHQASGQHQWQTAPSGTAGSAITWTNAMTLDASGNLSPNNIILPYSATDSYGYKQANSNGIWYGRVVPFSLDGTMLLETQYGGNGGGFRFSVDGAQKMKLNYTGNLLVGTTTDNGVDKLQVNGSINTANGSTLGGIKHSIITHVNNENAYARNAIHFKLNYKPGGSSDKMISLIVKGYNYGTSESFNATVSTYSYPGSSSLINSCTTDSRCTFYKSSDGYVVLKIQLAGSNIYFPSFVIDSIVTQFGAVNPSDLITVNYSSTNL